MNRIRFIANAIPIDIRKILKIYFTGIFLFTIFRLLLFAIELDRINLQTDIKYIFNSFLLGFRFDTVISAYILILPFVILAITSFFKKSKNLNKFVSFYVLILYTLAFLVCAVDIPYFNQFFSRFSITAFEWMDNPVFVAKMIFQEPRYWIAIVPFLICLYLFFRVSNKTFNKTDESYPNSIYLKIGLYILFLGLIFLGIRGRLEGKSPIRVGTAYFCNNAFLNQLGLNPNFTLMNSFLESRKAENQTIKLIDDKIALANTQQYLKISNPDKNFPLLRKMNIDSTVANKYNVVIVLMESMSAAKLERHGNKNKLTPFLDSISNQGYYFENTYSAGIHTFNGVYGTIFSYPAIFRQHSMKGTQIPKYHGLFSTLKENDYSTSYFTTHDGQFDNIEGFLKANDCERVYSKPDYPSDKVKTTLGVPDDYMFEYAVPMLTEMSKNNKPFVSVLMTASNHGPFYVPDYFKPKSTNIRDQIVEYSDYSLQKFINLSSKETWFKNTLFVFVADHGAPLDGTYDMSLDYNHSPLIFYAPNIIKEPKTFNNMAGQIDIFPSIMGLLNLPYNNNTLGIDLFKESRPYIYFNADDKYGVIDQEWLLIVRDKENGLYKYRNKDTKNYALQYPDIVEKMNLYAKSNLQSAQYVILKNKQ